MKIYVASSWRNERQNVVVKALLAAGHDVYDFKNPPNGSAFAWSQIDSNWQSVLSNGNIVDRRKHPNAIPIQENSLFGVVKPKPLTDETCDHEFMYYQDRKTCKKCHHTIFGDTGER